MPELVLAGALLVAFVNGANDNFKGVATLYGSGTLSYRAALGLGTLATGLGGLASLALAAGLIRAFSAKGLLPDALLSDTYLASVALGAGATVLLATRFGFPVSTTHALVGGLAGAGIVAAGPELRVNALGAAFVLPLLFGPIVALALALASLRVTRWVRARGWVRRRSSGGASPSGSVTGAGRNLSPITLGHVLSSSLVSFARGLNDTPKILGLVVGAAVLTPQVGVATITLAMGLGGVLAGRRVAETLARKITPMTPEQGLASNLATALLVTSASRIGIPVSTTHVSTGGIFGIGVDAGSLEWNAVRQILLAWVVTLPVAALLGAALLSILR